jgi:hypothetical protein
MVHNSFRQPSAASSRAAVQITASQPDGTGVMRHLDRLTAAYPAFAFSREPFARRGGRWVAERRDRAPGLRVVITGDLMELHAALQRDKASHAR